MNDITPEMKNVLDFIDGKRAADDYTKALEQEIESVRKNEKWRLDYMTLQMKYQEKYEQGMEQGIEKGMEQGIEKGIEQGIEQGKRQMALRMLKKNQLSIEDIANYTGLMEEQVEALKEELQMI